ncbi:Acyl-protein thioesterase 1 [Termitomyces sp. T112]|nr:hypothetical protein C0989_009215 [Termitomyces sp. Mn162]KAG5733263.1 Acyl-protein thioesterase 1 [Termitomyces sp. T112]KAH0587938.1 hypothetical protein H2248_006689 [Termitomyces sp. 'cryptogamus']KNZ76051.1 Acyl-protein thioesterase 1 [Termitomyces sp. J132]
MALPALKFLTINPVQRHTATVIFVHGLGDTGVGWKPVADRFKIDPKLLHVKWVLPHSPIRKVTANMGIEMPSWFDIYSFGFNTDEDEKGMLESARSINQLIANEIASGIEASRIVLGGFSQGGTMSLLTGLTGERRLAGIAALSSWLPLKSKFKSLASSQASSIPVFYGHGSADPLVKIEMCEDSAEFLATELKIPRTTNRRVAEGLSHVIYQGLDHSTNQEELDDLKEWIISALPPE